MKSLHYSIRRLSESQDVGGDFVEKRASNSKSFSRTGSPPKQLSQVKHFNREIHLAVKLAVKHVVVNLDGVSPGEFSLPPQIPPC